MLEFQNVSFSNLRYSTLSVVNFLIMLSLVCFKFLKWIQSSVLLNSSTEKNIKSRQRNAKSWRHFESAIPRVSVDPDTRWHDSRRNCYISLWCEATATAARRLFRAVCSSAPLAYMPSLTQETTWLLPTALQCTTHSICSVRVRLYIP